MSWQKLPCIETIPLQVTRMKVIALPLLFLTFSAMDQESNKAAWPKPAGGYQTITGRRYGRRHAYVSFKPCMTRHERSLGRAGDDYEVLELDDVPKENSSGIQRGIT